MEETYISADDDIITDRLSERPGRAPDHAAESRALEALAEELAERPENLLQKLADMIVERGIADSAGVSIDLAGDSRDFHWVALSGAWGHFRGGTMPFDASPCGLVVRRDQMLLIESPERFFPAAKVEPLIHEVLLVPFHSKGRPVGTLWINAHGPDRKFDREDARLLASLARFASAGYQMTLALRTAQAGRSESDSRLRSLAHASSDVFYIMSSDMRELRELRSGSFIADTSSPSRDWLNDYIPPEDHARTLTTISEAIRTKGVFQLEHRVRRVDGEVGWAMSRAVPILGADGGIIEWFGAASDITTRKSAEAALRDSEARQAFLLKLSDSLRPLRNARETLSEACRLLGEHLSASRAYYIEYLPEQGYGVVADDYRVPGLPSLAGRYPFAVFRSTYERIGDGRTWVVTDVTTNRELAEQERDFYAAQVVLSWVNVPLAKGGVLEATLCVVQTEPRVWTALEISLVEETAERLWAAVQRGRTEAALRESEERFAHFGEASSDVLWIRDAETLQWIYLTPAFETIYGLGRETALRGDNLTGWLDLIIPEDRQRALDSIRTVGAGERVSFEYRIRRPQDGAVRWLRNTDFPMHDANGRVCWVGGIGRDITGERASAERQDVLVKELQHRSRNLIGVVTALSNRTIGRGSPVESFTIRLKALSRAQALLSQSGSDTVEVEALVRAELAAHADGASTRTDIAGPVVLLTSEQVQNFALALHELTTNAVKYGALKGETGRLSVTWKMIEAASGKHLALDWVESGVDLEPEKVTRRGYGRELIERALAYALGGRTEYVLASGGVRCRIELPLA